MRRRDFLKTGSVALAGLAAADRGTANPETQPASRPSVDGPRVISTWRFGEGANKKAYAMLLSGASPLDAAQYGVMVVESDPEVSSVGLGGTPNRDGVVQLDASIQDGTTLSAGSVAALEGIENPIAVARKVMELTPHVLLVGDGAKQFALHNGFQERNLLTAKAKERWQKWRAENPRAPEDHDTIGLIARAADGTMAAACTTSGLSFKLPGRVGDSPLIGHGMYCDGEAGGAAATGVGEEVIRVAGSYQVVEFMRQGMEPGEACRKVCERILRRRGSDAGFVGFIAMRKDGGIGYYSTKPTLTAAVSHGGGHALVEAPSVLKAAAEE